MILSVRDSSKLSRLTVHAILTVLQRQNPARFWRRTASPRCGTHADGDHRLASPSEGQNPFCVVSLAKTHGCLAHAGINGSMRQRPTSDRGV